jgi:glycerol-1-phosphate dehydrogenase [NAD(P)+]
MFMTLWKKERFFNHARYGRPSQQEYRMNDTTIKDIDIYARHRFLCRCGKTHEMPIGKVVIRAGAASELPERVAELGFGKKGLLVTDEIIYESLGKDIYHGWKQAGLDIDLFVLKGRVIPDEEAVGQVVCNVPFDAEYIVSIGGGTVTDIVRYVTTRLGLPEVSIPSAMTMDGFFTNMSVIIINGLQRTYYLDYPTLILADTDIIAKAPAHMNAAGVGEVISKISAGLDWYAANLIKDIYYCDAAADMMGQCISEGTSSETIAGIPHGDAKAVLNLTDALYKSAVGMAWYGSSPCGSGAEHQLNHFWIKCQDDKGAKQSMHGQAVGVGAVVNLMIWEELLGLDLELLDFEKALSSAPTKEEWEQGVKRVYGDGAKDILDVQKNNHFFDRESRRRELQRIVQNAGKLRRKFESIPSADEISAMLGAVGAPNRPQQLNIDKQELLDSIYYAKEMRRGRYNALWMAETLGVLDAVAERVSGRLGY